MNVMTPQQMLEHAAERRAHSLWTAVTAERSRRTTARSRRQWLVGRLRGVHFPFAAVTAPAQPVTIEDRS